MPTMSAMIEVKPVHPLPTLFEGGPPLNLTSPMMVNAILAHFRALPGCTAEPVTSLGTYTTDYQVSVAGPHEAHVPLGGEYVDLVCRVFSVRILWRKGFSDHPSVARIDLSAELAVQS